MAIRSFGMKSFVAISCGLMVATLATAVYLVMISRTLEKRFSLSSQQTGFILSSNDVTFIVIIMVGGYLSKHGNKPRIMGATALIGVAGNICMFLPYFIFPRDKGGVGGVSGGRGSRRGGPLQTCDASPASGNATCALASLAPSGVSYAYYMLVGGQLLHGIGGSCIYSLAVAFMEQHAPKGKASVYIGVLSSMFGWGPMFAGGLAALCTRLPEDLKSTNLKPSDPAWIGAWWLGYLVIATWSFIFSVLMLLFPNDMDCDLATNDEKNEFKEKSIYIAKSFLTLVRNGPYMFILLCNLFGTFLVVGFLIHANKYFQVHFRRAAFIASLIQVCCMAVPMAIGTVLSGALISRLKLKLVGIARYGIIFLFLKVLAIIGVYFVQCERVNLHGWLTTSPAGVNVANVLPCNSNCSCSERVFQPVCDGNGITYISPCHAGCPNPMVNGTFMDCACAAGTIVRRGTCEGPCDKVILYGLAIGGIGFSVAMSRVAATMLAVRVIETKLKGFAMAFFSFLVNCFVFIPGPVVFGIFVDGTCKVWQKICGNRGFCMFYDTDGFRNVTLGAIIGMASVSALMASIAMCLIQRRANRAKKDSSKSEAQVTKLDTLGHSNGTFTKE